MIADLLAPQLRVVFCGTALGSVSAKRGLYYAGPGNKFWWILNEVGLTPRLLDPTEYKELLKHGIGLTDIVKDQYGADTDLRFESAGPAELERKVLLYEPTILCFNGKRAAKEYLKPTPVQYGRQDRTIGKSILYVVPSTSGAAQRWWDPKPWMEMTRLVVAQ